MSFAKEADVVIIGGGPGIRGTSMEEAKRIICVVCPLGCEGEIRSRGENKMEVNGFGCPRGEAYAGRS